MNENGSAETLDIAISEEDYRKLVKHAEWLISQQVEPLRERLRKAEGGVNSALGLLEPIQQAELRVFKARTFLRDAAAVLGSAPAQGEKVDE